MEGYRAAIRMLIEQSEGMAKDKKAKVVAKNTIQWLKLCHENANELADGNITPNIFTFGYGFPKASVREWMNNRKKKFKDKLRAKK